MKKALLLLWLPFAACNSGHPAKTPDQINAINIEIKDANNTLQQLQNNLESARGQVAVEKDKMDRVKEFHIGRTNAERDEQISQQQQNIDNANQNVKNIEQQISNQKATISNLQSQL